MKILSMSFYIITIYQNPFILLWTFLTIFYFVTLYTEQNLECMGDTTNYYYFFKGPILDL